MAKIQSYEIVFNSAQPNIQQAMTLVGNQFSSIRNIIEAGFTSGKISIISQSLSSDGKTLSVSRTWADDVYDEVLKVHSVANIKTIIESIDGVVSVNYGFTNA